jgi:hypothetical protein
VTVDLKALFDVSDEKIQDAMDILRPFENLVTVTVEGNEIQLPENNSLWRGMQFWGLMTGEIQIDFGLFCIAGTCKNCKCRAVRNEEEGRVSLLACQTTVQPGLVIKKLPNGFTYRKKQDWS